MPELNEPLICFAAVFMGGMLQGCLGFGFAFIALPVFAMFLAPLTATVMIVVLSLMVNCIVITACFKHADKKIIFGLLAGGVAGTPVGTLVLQHVDADFYAFMVGVLMMMAAGLFLMDKRVPLKNKMINYMPVGFVSGVLNASLGLSGPPVVLFMNNQALSKNTMRATMIGYFLLINVSALAWFSLNRLITDDVFRNLPYFVLAVIAGTGVGIFFSRLTDEKLFRKMILVLVMIIGFGVALKSLASVDI